MTSTAERPAAPADPTPAEIEHPMCCQNGPECRTVTPGEFLTH